MSKVYIRTQAYNAEKTLKRAMNSVLSQTYEDFIYYICDNGSTDGTRAIIDKFAKKDSRIRPFYNSVNRDFKETEEYLLLPYNIDDEDYYCILDADDEYEKNFLEEMICFMKQNNLGIAACGSNFFSVEQDNKLVGQRILSNDLIIEENGFEKYFSVYHVFLRTTWGKVFKGKTLRNTVQDARTRGFPRAYGGDTYNSLIAFGNAEKAGVLAKPLHRYYISNKSVSYRFDSERVESDQILHKAALNYLKQFGEISLQNQDFLSVVYLYALKDTLEILIHAKVSEEERLHYLCEMCLNEYTMQLAVKKDLGNYISTDENPIKTREDLFNTIGSWLLSLQEVSDTQAEKYCETGELVYAAMDSVEDWISFRKMRIQFLIDSNRVEEAKEKMMELRKILSK